MSPTTSATQCPVCQRITAECTCKTQPKAKATTQPSELNPKHPDFDLEFHYVFGYKTKEGDYITTIAYGKNAETALNYAKEHCAMYQYTFDHLDPMWASVRVAGQYLRRDQWLAIAVQAQAEFGTEIEYLRSSFENWAAEVNVKIPAVHGEHHNIATRHEGFRIIPAQQFNALIYKMNRLVRLLQKGV